MANLRATFHFGSSEMLLEEELLGSTHGLAIDQYRLSVIFPSHGETASANDSSTPDDELDRLFPGREHVSDLPGAAQIETYAVMAGSSEFVRVRTLRVEGLFRSGRFSVRLRRSW